MNFAILPEFVAIITLVGIFFSLLRRSAQTRLRYLFVGWLFVLVHFASMLVSPSSSPFEDAMVGTVAIGTLLLASAAFIWAGRAWDGDTTLKGRRLFLAVAPSLVYVAYNEFSGTSGAVYYALSALGFALTLGAAEIDKPRRFRAVDAAAIVAVYVGDAAIAAFSVEASIAFLLCCAYLAAAISFWRSAEKISIGTLATTWAFLLWATVFPVGYLFDRFLPLLHVDSEVWNLPKFLAASGMILALLEDQLSRNEQLALEDDLTGLPNRRLYEDRFAQSLSQARRNGHRVAYFSIDVDRFKEVNDTLGHVAGDEVLRNLATRFTTALRETDTLARTGGDEFGAIVSGVPDRSTAEAIADALHQSLASPLVIADQPLTTTVSVGVAIFPDDGLEAATLKAVADREMYREKRRSRDDVAALP
jgi:diguanylate cyclase (GGDEF)-like protein